MDREEFRRRIAARPNNVRFAEIEKLLKLYGFEFDSSAGSSGLSARV